MSTRYIDLTTDFGFKRLFGRQENSAILQAFLTDILMLDSPIVEVQILTQEQLPETTTERIGIYDVYCQDADGRRFIVEMQRASTTYFKERALFYSTFPITHQVRKGREYDFSLMPVYCICLLNYKMDDQPGYFRKIQLMDVERHQVFYDKYTFIFIEIPKFMLSLDEVQAMLDKWLYLFKHSTELREVPTQLQEPSLKRAFEVAELAAMTEEDQFAYHLNLKRLSDNQLLLQGQFEKGMREGMREGERKGERKGLLSGIKLVLKIKFGEAGERLFDELAQCEDIARLEAVQHILETATTVDVVRQVYEQEKHPS